VRTNVQGDYCKYRPAETRAAVIENGRLVEVYIERSSHQRHVGNIYKGRVENVLPGMQAAFVNIGLERNAFLYVDDALKAREGHFDDVDIEDLKALSNQRHSQGKPRYHCPGN